MILIGVNGHPQFGHDSGVSLILDGEVVGVYEEERFARVKHAPKRLPSLALAAALEALTDLSPDAALGDNVILCYPWRPNWLGILDSDVKVMLQEWFARVSGFRAVPDVAFVPHHLSHFFSGLAYVPSQLRDGSGVGVVIDGRGEQTSGACYEFSGESVRTLWHVELDASLGAYFEAASVACGLSVGEEGKTMGLAGWGRGDRYSVPQAPDGRVGGDRAFSSGSLRGLTDIYRNSRNTQLAAFSRVLVDNTFLSRADFAAACQRSLEDRILSFVVDAVRSASVRPRYVILAGGVALNCSINSRVHDFCMSEDLVLIVPPPASDSGVAFGASVYISWSTFGVVPLVVSAALGSDIEKSLHSLVDPSLMAETDGGALASRLARGWVVGWLDGAAEVGPRALGHRSILALPRSDSMRDRINFLKGRESWRPLAPIISERQFGLSLEGGRNEFMLLTDRVVGDGLSAVTHADGSTRPMVVRNNANLNSLLASVGSETSVEALVCTSFNCAGEPIVNTLEEALRSAKAMRLDALAGPGWIYPL